MYRKPQKDLERPELRSDLERIKAPLRAAPRGSRDCMSSPRYWRDKAYDEKRQMQTIGD